MPSVIKSRNECGTCGKVFTRTDKLKRHEETHLKIKKHQCSKCDKTFHRKSDLQRHEQQVHKKRAALREYKCLTCGEIFQNMAPFQAHQKTVHSNPSAPTKRPRDDDSGKNSVR